MSGLYLHIPFCRKACHYCNFHFSTTARYQDRMIQAMVREMDLQQNYLNDQLETVYLGGGTPSILTFDQLEKLFKAIRSQFSFSSHPEITMEANPDDISAESIAFWAALGINRLSLGIQSFLQQELSWMNRVHRADQCFEAIRLAKAGGLVNLNIDLIYGLPGSTLESWSGNLDHFFRLDLPHLSAYALTVEPKTALSGMIRKRKMEAPDEGVSRSQFLHLLERMESKGYWNYEISNYARPGALARHNTAYWQGVPYLGIGPSAHSYNGHSRQWNIAHNIRYMDTIEGGQVPCELEHLTPEKKYNEWVMTSLRTQWGCLRRDLARFDLVFQNHFTDCMRPWLERQLIVEKSDAFILSTQGKLWADRISSDLFYLEE